MYYWVNPADVRWRTNRRGDKLGYRKDGMPFRLTATDEPPKAGMVAVLNFDDGDCWSDGSVSFRRAVRASIN